jgi:hypothetical protein
MLALAIPPALLAACSGSVAPDTGGAGGTSGGAGIGACAVDADCGAGKSCAFKIADACAARGTCVEVSNGPQCKALQLACGCDNVSVNVACTGYPSGYAARPIAHDGPCEGPDGGSRTCSKDADCGGTDVCAFPVNGGCSALGACVTLAPGPYCHAYQPACTCDGRTISVVCNGYPNGTASAPILHTGQCEGIDAGTTFTCGNLACQVGTQVCKIGTGGPPPGTTTYECVAFPSHCATDHTCVCVKPALGAQLCSQDAQQDITVTFLYP